jgi:DNA-directed RNA polymerase specialized sigma24 family protein
MKLSDFAFSPNCRKVRAVAYELGIELEQVLTPAQRATLLLRDVVGMSAEEAAAALDQSVATSRRSPTATSTR